MCAKTVYEYTPEMEHYLIRPGSIDEHLDFPAIFSNTQPVEVEIGTGKGRFILAESLQRPETNFLGIERSLKWLRIALSRACRAPRPNCRFLCLDADLVVKLLLLPHSIQAYHVYFPDPWPKDRHHKRRLFHPRFIEKMALSLAPGGRLHLKTDHGEYFAEAHANLLAGGFFQVISESVSRETLQDIEDASDAATHYEIKFRKEAREIYSAVYEVMP
ncbi:MAG TPA: tRNA (guanosine(46)-N7)-methyltransferase TrmB [bacterium]|nr:tRNA (guanosine(46)-N7)-methyltransferase TrmB [Candidatus Omnitrophota bacterium]HOJ59865.1 tRNA (guanosine(46)-N7)-methyltransferase TrmB [bacterium]HOL93418.1 tRNA (guanosine(46)-N7)-methyltransferase TrmB [bacterium]HPP01149.1 tRNA (guanosine(46)-N7)-methyltransferase TrmB [bacterium]HXK94123.1 tRNA (guanosine(46)-N7)-methyltransferase TrmB [bacterium]